MDEEEGNAETHLDRVDGLTVFGGDADCEHKWEEMPDEPPRDCCTRCGGTKY